MAKVTGIVLLKKKFLSPDSALGFGSKLDATDAHRIQSSKNLLMLRKGEQKQRDLL